jgi:hypothetical protein
MTSDLREAIMDDIFGHDHVNLTILYCFRDNSVIMPIWPLTQTTMEGFSLKGLLLSYDGSYISKMDVEGMIGVKNSFSKRKWKDIVSINSISRIKRC